MVSSLVTKLLCIGTIAVVVGKELGLVEKGNVYDESITQERLDELMDDAITEELVRTLTLDYNKARQAAITAELVEVISGAEAL